MKAKKDHIRAFRKLLRRFEQLISHHLKENGCCEGVTLAQCHTLLEIEDLGKTTIGDLAKKLGLDKSTLSRTVEGLVNIGLVERVVHPTDRRFTLLKLTDQGTEICTRINKGNDQYFAEVFEGIPSENHQHLNHCIELLVDAMRKKNEIQFKIGDLRAGSLR
jgi:DNA-binding MarR family transcriptional regulator